MRKERKNPVKKYIDSRKDFDDDPELPQEARDYLNSVRYQVTIEAFADMLTDTLMTHADGNRAPTRDSEPWLLPTLSTSQRFSNRARK